jgi:serine/threonine-protein kinase
METQTPLLRLLGNVELTGPERPGVERVLAQPKLVALLALLAVPETNRFIRRDRIVSLLWPELDQARARAALRKALTMLRSSLGTEVVLSRGDEEIALDGRQIACDAAEFTVAADSGELARALSLYRGDLLPGFHLDGSWEFSQWLDDQRDAARERAAAAAWALAQRYERDTEFSEATRWARRAARFAALDERALRRALRMLERLGDRAGAVRLYEDFARRLRDELQAEPSPETIELVAQLRRPPTSQQSA